jgi:hypothetical protein
MNLQQAQLGIRDGEDWQIRTPDQEVLTTLPRSLTDGQAISIIEFMQRTERLAFNEGMDTGRGSMRAAHKQRTDALLDRMRSLESHNSMLAETLEKHLDGKPTNGDD